LLKRLVARSDDQTTPINWTYVFADLVHYILDVGRVAWLRHRGYAAEVVEFAPHCVTPKNRAIVAVRNEQGHLLL
jgi:hypothetical protein